MFALKNVLHTSGRVSGRLECGMGFG